MAGRSGLAELQLTAEEVERLTGAFRDERFRALLAEYAAELADPEQRRLYEAEVAALERERGVEARFVHPAPGYVLRTSQAGAQRCYLNVCSNPLVGRPEARAEPGGQRWSLPYSLAPGREELGRAGRRRLLYDVVFHPEALRLARRSARFRRLLSQTALEAVESRFGLQLDRANAAPLRGVAYKGAPQAAVLRRPLPGGAPPPADSPLPPFPYPCPPPAAAAAPPPPEQARPPAPTAPRWSLRHRSYVDLQDYRCCRDSAPSPVPRELLLTVELPLLRSAAQAALEIRGRELRLDSERPAYRLRLRLPYAVDEGRGRAAFDKAKRQLRVTLPVVAPRPRERLEGAGPAAGEEEEERGLLPPEQAPAPGPQPGPAPPVCAAGMDQAPPAPAGPSSDAALPAACAAEPRSGSAELPAGCSSSLAAPLCPPFQCTQDEGSLTLLLRVPEIQPRSFEGAVGTNHYRLRFRSEDSASYSLLLRFPPENKLAPQETGVNISPANAVIGLAKSPESAGLWGRMHFGLNSAALQELSWERIPLHQMLEDEERLFVSEENVDEFLDSVLCPSFLKQSTLESQPLIEVLHVTEDKSQIRLKQSLEVTHCEHGEKEHMVNSGSDQVKKENGNYFKTNIEVNHTAADTETDMTSGSFTTAKTIDNSTGHCLQLGPLDTSLVISGKSQKNEPQLKLDFTTGKSATSSECEKQELLHLEEEAKIRDEEVISSKPADENHHSVNYRAVSPIIKEINMQDGSMQIIKDHSTHCALIFQNSLLYELD